MTGSHELTPANHQASSRWLFETFFFQNPDPCGFMIPFDACFPFFFENGWGKKTHQLFTKSHEVLTVQKPCGGLGVERVSETGSN